MGVCDFCCLIENNGQCFSGFIPLSSPKSIYEEYIEFNDENGVSGYFEIIDETYEKECANYAYVIEIPGKLNKKEIRKSLKKNGLKWLSKFHKKRRRYDWDSHSFVHLKGYSDFSGETIWYKDENTYINVGINAYRTFVRGTYHPDQIPTGWYLQTLENYNVDLEHLVKSIKNIKKKDLFKKIVGLIMV